MNDETIHETAFPADRSEETASITEDEASFEPAAAIENRFLFVDVAALRAKQLRRGALPRLADVEQREMPHRLERIAMLEVENGLIPYSVPEPASRR